MGQFSLYQHNLSLNQRRLLQILSLGPVVRSGNFKLLVYLLSMKFDFGYEFYRGDGIECSSLQQDLNFLEHQGLITVTMSKSPIARVYSLTEPDPALSEGMAHDFKEAVETLAKVKQISEKMYYKILFDQIHYSDFEIRDQIPVRQDNSLWMTLKNSI